MHVNQYLMCINTENHPTVEFFMFISITFPYIARLYETIEAWLSSWINANSTFVQYLFLYSFDILLQTLYANCM